MAYTGHVTTECIMFILQLCDEKQEFTWLANLWIGSKQTILLLNIDGVIKPDSLASYKKLHCWRHAKNEVSSFLIQRTHSPMRTLIVFTHFFSCLCVKSLLSISTFLLNYMDPYISTEISISFLSFSLFIFSGT